MFSLQKPIIYKIFCNVVHYVPHNVKHLLQTGPCYKKFCMINYQVKIAAGDATADHDYFRCCRDRRWNRRFRAAFRLAESRR